VCSTLQAVDNQGPDLAAFDHIEGDHDPQLRRATEGAVGLEAVTDGWHDLGDGGGDASGITGVRCERVIGMCDTTGNQGQGSDAPQEERVCVLGHTKIDGSEAP
jgi:hypothetical protein